MDQTVDLGSITRAYDRTRYLGSAEYPGKGRLSCRPAMTRTHLLESFSEGKIFRELRFLKFRIASTPIPLGKVSKTLPRHCSREQSRSHRGIDNGSHIMF